MDRKRRFGGKVFKLVGEYKTKAQANIRKKRAMDAAIPVRVIKTKRGYSVWARV